VNASANDVMRLILSAQIPIAIRRRARCLRPQLCQTGNIR